MTLSVGRDRDAVVSVGTSTLTTAHAGDDGLPADREHSRIRSKRWNLFQFCAILDIVSVTGSTSR
ncbi:hypothetical protein RHOER0001_4806 [Rhodococcus erythropolis SK121]|nr:hypothetical protein RHOER0001_4806 [Rhodococcus erythropolis SK121]